MGSIAVDKEHWLYKLSPNEWISAALSEIRRAEEAYGRRDARAGLAGCRRAAGMALNGALIVEPREAWGRTYIEHLAGLQADTTAPEVVRSAAGLLIQAQIPSPSLVLLRTRGQDQRLVEAAKDVMAHGYAVVRRHDADE